MAWTDVQIGEPWNGKPKNSINQLGISFQFLHKLWSFRNLIKRLENTLMKTKKSTLMSHCNYCSSPVPSYSPSIPFGRVSGHTLNDGVLFLHLPYAQGLRDLYVMPRIEPRSFKCKHPVCCTISMVLIPILSSHFCYKSPKYLNIIELTQLAREGQFSFSQFIQDQWCSPKPMTWKRKCPRLMTKASLFHSKNDYLGQEEL